MIKNKHYIKNCFKNIKKKNKLKLFQVPKRHSFYGRLKKSFQKLVVRIDFLKQ